MARNYLYFPLEEAPPVCRINRRSLAIIKFLHCESKNADAKNAPHYPAKIMPAKLALMNVANEPQIQADRASLAKSPRLLGESCP